MITIIESFHFLRPWWFLALIPALIVLGLYHWRSLKSGNWADIINPDLLPYLIQGKASEKSRGHIIITMIAIAWLLSCIGLAGPAWKQLPQPVYKEDSALVVILDLSPSMLAEDIPPSRLVRARFKLIDILTKRNEGVVGLIVYGGDSYTVSPLTEDSNTIVSMVPVLSPDLLPEYGSNVEASLDAAVEVALSGGYDQADFLLITDGVDSSAIKSIAEILSEAGDFRLSVLGVGTQDGAPIPTRNGGFAKRNDNVVIAKLDPSKLQGLASRHGGVYQTIRADDKDIESLIGVFNASFMDNNRKIDRSFDLWDDQGYWLIILILPFTFFAFRRGIVASILIIPILLSTETVTAYEWVDLWETADQQAAKAMNEGNLEAAKNLFDNTQWRGSAAYKSGDYEEATNNFKNGNDSISHYNRGNALAKKGDLSGAIEAYDEALSTNSDFDDAAFNKKLVQRLKDQQNQDQQNQDQQNQDQQNQDQQNQDQQNQDQQNQDQQNQDQQNQDQQNQDQQNQDEQNQDQQNQEMEKKDRPKEQLQQASEMTEAQKEEQQEIDRMLRRVPDDPGGLLRAKFRYQSKQRTRTPKPPTYQERW